ncbi:hypothetical protein DNTS_033073 [Danionella cerebrum]|uniref:FHF complex subunit HOOK-interacting protein C-terminal domain-containing protein n=1 Tax=Danionella cerebrum TaxID=2873325 RepID=A0A553MK99_9TELE|nr:hypothetical protein DNTS_033073 [Danionella translucida]
MLASGSSGGRALSLMGVDPETCMIVFKNHWTQVLRILEKHEPARCGAGAVFPSLTSRFGSIPVDEASAVQNYVEHMLFLLMEEESGQGGAMGPILELVIMENVMEKLFLWSLRRQFTDEMKLEQLRMYKMLLTRAKQPLLHHKPILRPLMMLLSACSSSSTVGPHTSGVHSSCMKTNTSPVEATSTTGSSCDLGPSCITRPSITEDVRCSVDSTCTMSHTGDVGSTGTNGPTTTAGSTYNGGHTAAVSSTQNIQCSSVVEAELVSLLHQLCCVLVRDASMLELFFHSSQDQGAANFLIFSLLVPFIHREGDVGSQARDALALIMNLSSRNELVAKHIVENTYFCPVLATGLSALYSDLPAKLELQRHSALSQTRESLVCLEHEECVALPELLRFLHSLQFCGTVCKVAHPSIRDQLLGYIYNGFLLPVMAPALHKLTVEEVTSTTAYLELFLRSVSDSSLLQTFLIFILRHRHESVSVLDSLVSRVNTPFQLGVVSLALFRTLIGLFCEDVMLQLILRYLVPCAHLSVRARFRLRTRDCSSITAAALLSLTPSFFLPESHTPSPPETPKPDYILWSKVTQGLLRGSMESIGFSRVASSEHLIEKNYLQYLLEARRSVCLAAQACLVWSAPYDGLSPSPDQFEEEENEHTPQNPTNHAPSEISSSSGDRERAELEWDDFEVESDAEAIADNSSIPDEPPKHIQEMRKSAIMLVKGAYVEESDFQDDVLVYNLIAQKDAQHPESWPVVNGHDSVEEKPHAESVRLKLNDIKRHATDFISQCEELIEALGGEEDSGIDDEEHMRKLRMLLHEEREEDQVDFNLFCEDPEDEGVEEDEWNKTEGRKLERAFTGPFISVLLSRLENMLENSPEVNLLVTGILAQLATYPQPLLRDFILNTRPANKNSPRSPYQVLQSVGCQIEWFSSTHPDFPDLAREAAQYLLLRDQTLTELESEVHLHENTNSWFLNGHISGRPHKPLPPCPKIPAHLHNRVFATLLFTEFLKELAAIAQEHSIFPGLTSEE